MQAISQATPSDNDNGWSCDVVRRFSAFMAQRAHLGEVGAAQDALDTFRHGRAYAGIEGALGCVDGADAAA